MVSYIYYNPNPKGKRTGDCVIRALTLATGKPYEQVYRELFEISLKTGWILNEKRVEDKFLETNGFVKMKQPKRPNGKKYQICEIDQVCSDDIIVIRCAHHLVCVKGMVIHDTFNCGYKTINNYYVKRGR